MSTENITFAPAMFQTLSATKPENSSWEQLAAAITGGDFKPRCMEYRRLATLHGSAAEADRPRIKSMMSGMKRSMPAFIASVELCGGRSVSCVRGYTGYIMVDIDHIPSERFAAAERAVKSDAHAFMAYVTLSGLGLRVIARAGCTVTRDNFSHVWNTVNKYFAGVAGAPFDRQCCNATRMSCLSHDPTAVYNPDAVPVPVDPPAAPAGKSRGRPPKAAGAAENARRMTESEGIRYVAGEHNKYVSRCVYWMNRFGVEDEQTLSWALEAFSDYDRSNGHPVRAIVKSIYTNHAGEHGSYRLSAAGTHAGARTPLTEIEAWLRDRYRLRKNSVTQFVEIQDMSSRGDFAELTDEHENSVWCEMQRDGIRADMITLRTLLHSSFVPAYNPFAAYISGLEPWDGTTDHVGRFLSMVHCRGVSPATFDFYIRRWLVAMVASALCDDVINHEIFVLLGPQGTYKSSFMNNILPPCLRRYYCVKTNSQRITKDDLLALTENMLINMEEIDSMARAEVNQLKAMVSMPYVNERPPYGRNKVRLPHVASFCATGNNLQFLTDDTGNRRWLVFEVEHIDNPWTATINHDGMYAQLRYLLDSGFKYWFDGSDMTSLNRMNSSFEAPDMARELIVTHYRCPQPCETVLYLSSSQIVARFSPQVKLSAVSVGKALSDLGFEQVRTVHGRFWKVVEIPLADIGRSVPGQSDCQDDAPF